MTTHTLFKKVNLFDGKSENLIEEANVLIEGNKIKAISTEPIEANGAEVIDGDGRTLMPGLIDCHVHLGLNMPIESIIREPADYVAAMTLVDAEATLMRGYTTVRDMMGTCFGVKRAIDEGHFPGPRIYAAGAGIGMTGGHVDFQANSVVPRALGGPAMTDADLTGGMLTVDGVTAMLAAVRLQFRRGAHLIKLATSGSIEGMYDPLDVTEFSFEEIKAAADEAKRWHTYLAVHVYPDEAIRQSLEAGAMSIEHGCFISEDTMKVLVEKGAYLCTQTSVFLQDPPSYWDDDMKAKQVSAQNGVDNLMKLAKKHKAKIAIGTDLVGSLEAKSDQRFELSNRQKWFSPFEILNQALVSNAELLSWTGPRNPYPGKLGSIEEGAYADILLVNGNPLEDLKLFNDPDESLALIMKDGRTYKSTL